MFLDNETTTDYGPQIVPGCQYFDLEQSQWSMDGCVILNTSTNVTTYCLCSHLTDFGVGDMPKPNRVELNPTKIFTPTPSLALIFAYTVIGTIFFLYLLGMVYARRKD